MSYILGSEYELTKVSAPNLPIPPVIYDQLYQDQFNNVLRLYFNQLNNILGQLVAVSSPIGIYPSGTAADAFGRLRVSNPYTLFDSQNRYAADNQFDTYTSGGGTTNYLPNEASVELTVPTTSAATAVRQSYRCMPYQPGKGLMIMATFVLSPGKGNLRQRIGYFNENNGVFFQMTATTPQFVLRTNTSGTPSDARTVDQADWNGDKLDGTGASGLTLDLTKAQIFWADFEWLGVGSVRCGFIINGQMIVCHTFQNANVVTSVYMTTAILPVRYEITNTGTTASNSTLKQICSTVISDGGYSQISQEHVAQRTTALASISTTLVPLVSIRLNSSNLGAVVLPMMTQAFPTTAGDYELQLVKNPTLTGASWTSVTSDTNVQQDVAATAMTGGTIVQVSYLSATNKSGTTGGAGSYNWDLQLGASITGTSDIFTLGIRTLSGTGSAIGSLSFYDLTQ